MWRYLKDWFFCESPPLEFAGKDEETEMLPRGGRTLFDKVEGVREDGIEDTGDPGAPEENVHDEIRAGPPREIESGVADGEGAHRALPASGEEDRELENLLPGTSGALVNIRNELTEADRHGDDIHQVEGEAVDRESAPRNPREEEARKRVWALLWAFMASMDLAGVLMYFVVMYYMLVVYRPNFAAIFGYGYGRNM
ncbi:uncharacterized protein LOC132701342 [Cylas formicarius]|uniref:uncharacterized protein LOC132701342 n=1 Tax=Cylas formicarius TaxID=197179 RepID=UPI00295884F4|nr:uncharacterized protein LOC132701342 [Cylas formicarius]